MNQPEAKRPKLRLKVKRPVTPSSTSKRETPETIDDRNGIQASTKSDSWPTVRAGSVHVSARPDDNRGNSQSTTCVGQVMSDDLSELRRTIAYHLPQALGIQHRSTIPAIPPLPINMTFDVHDVETRCYEIQETKTLAGISFDWTPLPKVCLHCWTRKPSQQSPDQKPVRNKGESNIQPVENLYRESETGHTIFSDPPCSKGSKDVQIASKNVSQRTDKVYQLEQRSEDLMGEKTGLRPLFKQSPGGSGTLGPAPCDLLDVTVVEPTTSGSDSLPREKCPLCQVSFDRGLDQVDMDAHIAACFAAADADIAW